MLSTLREILDAKSFETTVRMMETFDKTDVGKNF